MTITHIAFVLAACATCVFAFADAASTQPATLRVMSFNVRLSSVDDGINAWPLRRELFFQRIEKFDPDLIGFQEVMADQHDDIEARMPGFTLIGVARDDGKRGGEWSCLAFRTTRFTMIDHGDFWLSQTPDVPGSRSWDAAFPRLCSWAILKDNEAGRELLAACTHWDHVGVVARQQAARICRERLQHYAGDRPVILIGDLNSTEHAAWMQPLLHGENGAAFVLLDSYREVHPQRGENEATFHAFKGTAAGERIDFILHTPQFQATAAGIDQTEAVDGRYPSDHYPVTATLRLKL